MYIKMHMYIHSLFFVRYIQYLYILLLRVCEEKLPPLLGFFLFYTPLLLLDEENYVDIICVHWRVRML